MCYDPLTGNSLAFHTIYLTRFPDLTSEDVLEPGKSPKKTEVRMEVKMEDIYFERL